MSVSLLLGAFLSAAPVQASTEASFAPPKQALSLGFEPALRYEASLTVSAPSPEEDGVYATARDGDLRQAESRLQRGQVIYGIGTTGAVVGLVTTGVGLGVTVVGLIPAIFGSEEMLLVGVGTMLTGGIIFGVSVPVMMVGGTVARLALQDAGIPYSPVPRWVMLGGVGMLGGGIATASVAPDLSSPLMSAGLLCVIGGSAAQMINTRRAFRTYEAEHAGDVSWSLVPMVTQEARGAALTVRF